MFFDMLDPFIVWKQVFHVVQKNSINDPKSAEVWRVLWEGNMAMVIMTRFQGVRIDKLRVGAYEIRR